MRSFQFIVVVLTSVIYASCINEKQEKADQTTIGTGEMPDMAKDDSGKLHVVYGNGDSIIYSFSKDHGKSFSAPEVVALLPELVASHMRGPQIAVVSDGIIVTACNGKGDIFSYNKKISETWQPGARVNDVDTVGKEGLMALSGDEQMAYAVWLDLRDKHNKVFGAVSTDGGQHWSKNKMIYTSPDSTVCECCKPSVIVKGNNVFVMFRNWLNGNRDLYLIKSADGGNTFEQAQKLGDGNWALNGCPMDGGALALDKNGQVQTIWRREGRIYACKPGEHETEIGEGKSCKIESINGNNVYAWTENGEVTIIKPKGIKTSLGEGKLPVIKAINNGHVICVWENEKEIHAAVVEL